MGLAWPRDASAQGWLADRRYTEGAGIRTGDLELHPGIGAEVGYDSNWFYRSHTEGPTIVNGPPALPPSGTGILRITPSFYVSTLGGQRLEGGRVDARTITFRGGVALPIRIFFGNDETSKQHNVGVASDARVDINQGRPIGFGIFAGYNRLIQPQVVADPNLSFNRSDIRGGAEIVAIPGGGTLDLRGGYQMMAQLFETTNGAPYSSLTHEAFFRNRWRFRPRTALFSDTTLRWVNYLHPERASNYLNDSTPLRTRFGLTGLVTERFGALAAVGYGATFFKAPELVSSTQYDSVNAQAEGTFYLGQGGGTDEPGQSTLLLSTWSLGFLRDFQASLLGNFYNTNRIYTRLEYWFGGKMVMRLDAFGEQLNYPPVFLNVGGTPTLATGSAGAKFTNYRVGGGFFAEYRFTPSFGLNTTIDYVQQMSDTQIPAGPIPGSTLAGVYDLNYRRFQAFLGVRYFW
jgi:hypothetical protein